ncbi:DnaB-like helicase N-terminal domain-containing protein [Rhodococcus tukisamuensis]|uniref:DnaB-like helicase N terminal domain-containing protein n=1 Tax=Rhodococcus tukisamuensis TaxID=168276 RepID=A0A1G6UTY2_9NOCA|nr:DnaB-like helicase N-terminal domain-containing protein [Rhodococcus tukisamuensis]SDD44176.1 DnaB-like helicase N terminal domain-containing protein [Rhodococcus tukisamuensis]
MDAITLPQTIHKGHGACSAHSAAPVAAVLSERIVLGAMLRGDDPGFTQDTLGRLAPAAFTIPAHRTVYAAIARTADTGTVDLSTVMLTLGDNLTAVGGFEQLSAAVQESFTSTAPTDHVARLADQATLDRRRAAPRCSRRWPPSTAARTSTPTASSSSTPSPRHPPPRSSSRRSKNRPVTTARCSTSACPGMFRPA